MDANDFAAPGGGIRQRHSGVRDAVRAFVERRDGEDKVNRATLEALAERSGGAFAFAAEELALEAVYYQRAKRLTLRPFSPRVIRDSLWENGS